MSGQGEQLKCHGRSWENSGPVHFMAFKGFAEFWPQYVRAHSRHRTRLLHAIGSVLAVVMLGVAFAVNLWFLIAIPLVGYGFAWYSHFFVERNHPATFSHPFYSVVADYRMTFLMMAGRMDEEVVRYMPVDESEDTTQREAPQVIP
jgi:hypothetical protein